MSWVTAGVTIGTGIVGASKDKKLRKQQEQREAEYAAYEGDRQQRIDQTRGVVDAAYDSPKRQRQYADYAAALREFMGSELVRAKKDAARNLKFSLARAGQTGGSVAADASTRLGEEFARGALDNERQVQGNVAQLQDQDETSRRNLLSLVDNGMGVTDALRRSNESLTNTLGRANTQIMSQGLGDVFADTAATYKAINERVAQRRGFGYRANRADLYD